MLLVSMTPLTGRVKVSYDYYFEEAWLHVAYICKSEVSVTIGRSETVASIMDFKKDIATVRFLDRCFALTPVSLHSIRQFYHPLINKGLHCDMVCLTLPCLLSSFIRDYKAISSFIMPLGTSLILYIDMVFFLKYYKKFVTKIIAKGKNLFFSFQVHLSGNTYEIKLMPYDFGRYFS